MDIRENYKKRIVLADKVNHEQSDIELYRKFEKHEIFGLTNEKRVPYHELFIFFMSIGIIYDKKEKILKSWNNVTVTGLNEKYVHLIAALSFSKNKSDNLSKPSKIAKDAEEYAKGGLRYLDKRLEEDGVEVFLKELTHELNKKCDLLSQNSDS